LYRNSLVSGESGLEMANLCQRTIQMIQGKTAIPITDADHDESSFFGFISKLLLFLLLFLFVGCFRCTQNTPINKVSTNTGSVATVAMTMRGRDGDEAFSFPGDNLGALMGMPA
jgi:hypothetical protein